MNNPNTKFDLVWGRVTRVLSFLGGMGIMVYETALDKSDRPWLYAAAVGMMGLPVARAAEGVLSRLSGTGPQHIPGGGEEWERPPAGSSAGGKEDGP